MKYSSVSTLLAVTLVPLAMLFQSCGGNSEASQDKDTMDGKSSEESVNVQVEEVHPRDFVSRLSLVGEVMSETDALLSCEVGGRLDVIRADRGSRVTEGDTLVVLDARRYQAAYDAVLAQQANAELDYQMADRLYTMGQGISETDWKKAANGLRMAEAGLANARIDLENCYITAPVDGIVAERFVDMGELIAPGTPVLQLIEDGRLKVRCGLPETQVTFGREGQSVVVRVVEAGLEVEGVVSWVGSVLDGRSRTLPVEIKLQDAGSLKIGMACQVELQRLHGSSLVVPVTVVQSAPDGLFLFTEVEGKASLQTVTLGERDGSQVEILDGLSAGSRLVTSGYRGLVDGQPLRVVNN